MEVAESCLVEGGAFLEEWIEETVGVYLVTGGLTDSWLITVVVLLGWIVIATSIEIEDTGFVGGLTGRDTGEFESGAF